MDSVWHTPEHPAWARLSRQLQPVVAEVSGRTDVVVSVRPETQLDSAAEFSPADAEVRVDAGQILHLDRDNPRLLDLASPSGRSACSPLIGAVVIQGRVAGLVGLPTDLSPSISRWLSLLAALRASAGVVRLQPSRRTWLRAALQVSCPGVRTDRGGPIISRLVWYVGQVPAGVLTVGEAQRAANSLLLLVGPERFERVRTVLRCAGGTPEADSRDLLSLARQLSDDLDEDTTAGDGAIPDATGVEQSITQVAHTSQALLAPPSQDTHGSEQREAAAALRDISHRAAYRVFRPRDDDPPSHPPSTQLWTGARRLAAALRAAQIRDPEHLRTPSATPPGLTRMSELMRRDAQVAAGTAITALPWRQLRRRTRDEPDVRVGLSWDVSASRAALHEEMCDVAWAMAWATRRAGGNVAAVAWHDRPVPVIWPGRVPARVPEPVCAGKSSGCPDSLRALDGALGLAEAPGLRLLVVATDGKVPNRWAVQAEVSRLVQAAVRVLWLRPAVHSWVPRGVTVLTAPPGGALALMGSHLTQALALTAA